MLFVTAERIRVFEFEIGIVQRAEILRPFVVLEDLFAVQLFHVGERS